MLNITIQETDVDQLETILSVEQAAFLAEPSINTLVSELLSDPTARPILSLLAFQGEQAIGHILFSNAQLDVNSSISATILAPLAVIPAFQNQGVGKKLVQAGLKILEHRRIALVFVLGHPTYYPRFGFQTAIPLGFSPTYPILDKNIDAWMVKALQPNILGKINGKVLGADALNKPEYWRE